MGIKKSVMLSDQTVHFINRRNKSEDGPNWSTTVNQSIVALEWVAKQSLPDLSNEEWQTVLNVYAGCIMDYNPPYRVASDMMDDAGAISIDDLTPEYGALVRKIHGMSQAEQFAILDFVNQFWAGNWDDMPDFGAIKAAITGN